MARSRGRRGLTAAYIPVASNAGDLAAMAQANAAFGEAMSGVGSAIKTGATDWAGHETDRAVQYLDTLADDQARNAALAQMQQDPIGAFLDVGAATKAVDAMQLRDFKVDERAEQALKSDDAHKEAVRALTQQKIMDPKEVLHKDATVDSLTTTTAETQKKIDRFDDITDSALGLEKEETGLKASQIIQRSDSDIATKKKALAHLKEKKKFDDTIKIGKQYEKILKMPLTPNYDEMPLDLNESQQEQWSDNEKTRLNMAQLGEVNKQLGINKAAGDFDTNERLLKFTRKHLAQSGFQLTAEHFVRAGVGPKFTPDSHNALIDLIMTDLARDYPHNTQTELKNQAKKIISIHPGNLNQNFIYGKRIADMEDPKRLEQEYKRSTNKQIGEIQRAKGYRGKLAKIAKYQKMNARIGLPPGQQTRFDETANPIIEGFVGSLNANAMLIDSLPAEYKDDPKFTEYLQGLVSKYKTSGAAIGQMDINLFTPKVQQDFYKRVRKNITDQLGPMLKSELTPLVNMVMEQHPTIGTQFQHNQKGVILAAELTKVSSDLQVTLAKQNTKKVAGYQESLYESIIKGIYATAKAEETTGDINPVQLEKSVHDTIRNIKTALGVGVKHKDPSKNWTQSNINALNIAIGGMLSGVRVDPDIEGNDYVIPHIAMGTDIRELRITQLIEGLKGFLEFGTDNVKGNTDIFNAAVNNYVAEKPSGAKAEGWFQKALERGTVPGQMEVFDNRKAFFPWE